MPDSIELSGNMEDYLEAIFHIVSEKSAARAKDIAAFLNVKNSSVTGALRHLSEKGFINYTPYDIITLTMQGNRLARDIVRRHEALRDFFVKVLNIEPEEAEDTACKMEHSVSRVILDRFIRFTEFVEICPRCGSDWIKAFWEGHEKSCSSSIPYEKCDDCLSQCMEKLRGKKEKTGNKSAEISLRRLALGQKGKILSIKSQTAIDQRLARMGVGTGSVIEVENVSPLGDSMDIKVKGYHLNIREDEAENITIQLFS